MQHVPALLPAAELAAWLKAWLLADGFRKHALTKALASRSGETAAYKGIEFMLGMTPDEFAACLLAAEKAIPLEEKEP